MKKSVRSQLVKRWPAMLLAGATGAGMTVGGLRLQALLQRQLPVILKSRLEAALGRPVEFGALHVTPTGMWVDELRVARAPYEIDDPLTAHHLRVSLDWWSLMTARQIHVLGVDLEGARLVVSPGAGGAGEPWTAQLLSFNRSGISHVGLQDTAIRVAGRSGRPDQWSAAGVNGELSLSPAEFHYQGRAASWTGASVSLAGLHVEGSGDRDALHLKDGGATYQGGRFQASGTVGVKGGADLTVRVKELALSRLASQIGIPADWAMLGRVTGEVRVDARNNTLRGVKGRLRVDRGSVTRDGSRFPWKEASADLDWSPRGASLTHVKVTGPGVELTGAAEVKSAAGQPFTQGRFHLNGEVRANGAESVATVSELLAFRRMLNGRWKADGAQVRFNAEGTVGDIRQATASGHVQVDHLEFRPKADGEAVRVSHLEADARRGAHEFTLSNLEAQTEGLALHGELALTDDRPGKPGQFQATGTAEVKDLKSLRAAIPQATLWKWVPAVMPTASGSLEFTLGGPVADPDQLWADGRFEARDFRIGGHSALPNGAMFFVPIRNARGVFHHTAGELTVSNLELEAPTFSAGGDVRVRFSNDPRVSSRLHLTTDDWRSLPAAPADALAELTGGHFEAEFGFDTPLSRLAQVGLDGSFTLRDAAYAPRNGKTVPVRSLGAQFRWANGALDLPRLALDSPALSATGHGAMVSGNVTLDLDAKTGDAGALATAWAGDLGLHGGAGVAQLHLEGALNRLAAAAVTGKVQLADAKLARPIQTLGLSEVDARELTAQFARRDGKWDLSELSVKGPQLTLALRGGLDGSHAQGDLQLQLAHWTAPESLPLTGGAVTLNGRLEGDLNDAKSLRFAGDARIENAAPRYSSKGVAVSGGRLTLAGHGESALSDAAQWLRSGTLELSGADVTQGGATRRVQLASAKITREGEGFRLADLRFQGTGVTASGGGFWSPAGHRLQLAADTTDLAGLGVALPHGFGAKRLHLEGTLEGTADQPLRSAQGEVKVDGAHIELAGASAQNLDSLLGAFHYTPGGLRIDRLEGHGPAGVITASGAWSPTAQSLQLTARGDEFSRLGVALPEGFHVGGYQLTAQLTGTAAHPLSAGSGTVEVRDARYPFGPGAPRRLDTASARFTLDGGGARLTALAANGPDGRFTGSGALSGDRFQLALAAEKLDPQFAAWLLPGAVQGGQLTGALQVSGNVKSGLQNASGRFELANAAYRAPQGSGMSSAPIAVAKLSGDYRWADGAATIQNLLLQSDRLNGTGALTLTGDGGHLAADLSAADLGGVADLFPALKGSLKGGVGVAKLDTAWAADGLRGSVRLTDTGGALHLPNMPAEFATQPLDQASVALLFQPGKLTVEQVQLRGPKGNADGSGSWTADGGVTGSGKAWFTKKYTSTLLPKGFAGFMARLMGVKELKTDFTLGGTPDKVTLNAGITKSWIWKYAKGRVPKEFQAVAAGKNPLWEKTPVVARITPAETIASTEAGQQ